MMPFSRPAMTEAESVVCPLDTVDSVQDSTKSSWNPRDSLSAKAEKPAAYVLLSLLWVQWERETLSVTTKWPRLESVYTILHGLTSPGNFSKFSELVTLQRTQYKGSLVAGFSGFNEKYK